MFGEVDNGYTLGFVSPDGVVTGFTPKGDLPNTCSVDAVGVAVWSDSDSLWHADSEKPLDISGRQPGSLMATFYGPMDGAYQFRADMALQSQFRTADYTAIDNSKALVLQVDCN